MRLKPRPKRRLRYLAAAAPPVLVALAGVMLLGSAVMAPQPTPIPPLAATSPGIAGPTQASSSPASSAAPIPSPTPVPATPTPSFALASPFDEYYPMIAPSTPLDDNAPGQVESGGSEGALTSPGDGRATRVVIPSLRIDLPVVAGDLHVRGNRNNYPLCDVAQYMTVFAQPGHEGTAYIYGHAQRGMFLPMLRASWRNSGRALIGARVEVYTSDAKLHSYEIVRVKRHSTDLNIAFNVPDGQHQLIVQTSEGPPGHKPVLQVKAKPIRVVEASAAEAMPTPSPRACLPRR